MDCTKTTPIKLFRGDDTDAFGLRTITIKITGDLDLTNATATFSLLGITKSWTNAETKTGTLTMSLSSSDTGKLPIGLANGTLRLYDGTKRLTVVNTIPFEVTNRVEGSTSQEYDLNVTLSVDTEVNVQFVMQGNLWGKNAAGTALQPIDANITNIEVPALSNVQALGARYTLADVANLVNTILASLKA